MQFRGVVCVKPCYRANGRLTQYDHVATNMCMRRTSTQAQVCHGQTDRTVCANLRMIVHVHACSTKLRTNNTQTEKLSSEIASRQQVLQVPAINLVVPQSEQQHEAPSSLCTMSRKHSCRPALSLERAQGHSA